jgi:GNAT superfamily N-acetyltransferase
MDLALGLATAVPLITRDADEFAAAVEEFLVARPVEHNVVMTVLAAARTGAFDGPYFAWATEADRVVGAAMRTPPHPLIGTTMTRETARVLMPVVLEADPDLAGVVAVEPAAGHLARAWREETGGTVTPRMGQVLYVLDEIASPSPPPGRPRLAGDAERDLLVDWAVAFAREAGVEGGNAAETVDRGLAHGRLFVWDDGGAEAVVGISPAVGGVVRISFVYTPPEGRGRGLASALTAHVSRRALDGGASQVMLYADRANPTSNSVYRAIGFRQAGDACEYALDRGAPATAGPGTARR